MSKITPKNLHYNTTLPPFLARMQAGHAERDGRHEFDVARPRKQRDAAADAEDEPVYFDEETGESLTKMEWEEREKKEEGENEEEKESRGDEKQVDKGERVRKENMAVIGGPIKKRKMGKVVGGEDDGEDDVVKEKKGKEDQTTKPEKSKSAKKGKKIKLSFGDDE